MFLITSWKKNQKSIARLVYYHFVEQFDHFDRNILISCKDLNAFNLQPNNLEKISAKQNRLKILKNNRARNLHFDYSKPVSQYNVHGEFLANYESIYEAEKHVNVVCETILDAVTKTILTAGGYRWFWQNTPPQKEDFIISQNPKSSEISFNKNLWEKLGKPPIDKKNPPGIFNLSLETMPEEIWKPIPGFEGFFEISNKGRVKRLSNWIIPNRAIFLPDQIMSLIFRPRNSFLYVHFSYNGKKNIRFAIHRLLYCCFKEEFDLKSNNCIIRNENKNPWELDISKLKLIPFKKKEKK